MTDAGYKVFTAEHQVIKQRIIEYHIRIKPQNMTESVFDGMVCEFISRRVNQRAGNDFHFKVHAVIF
jgi:hypothetical protein